MMPVGNCAIDRDRDEPHACGALAKSNETLFDGARTQVRNETLRDVGGASCVGSLIRTNRHECALACVTAVLLR
jgi:hypothetical protein